MRHLVAILISATILFFISSLGDAAPIGLMVIGSESSSVEKTTCRCALGLRCICRLYWAPAWGWRAPGWAAGVPGGVWAPRWDWGAGIFGGPAAGLYGSRYSRYRSRYPASVNDRGWSGEGRWPPK